MLVTATKVGREAAEQRTQAKQNVGKGIGYISRATKAALGKTPAEGGVGEFIGYVSTAQEQFSNVCSSRAVLGGASVSVVEQGVPFGILFPIAIVLYPPFQSLHVGPVTTNKVFFVRQHMTLNFLKSILLLMGLLGGAHARGDCLLLRLIRYANYVLTMSLDNS